MSKQESDSSVHPKSSSLDAFANQCADLAERVLSGEITWDQMADEWLGPEPEITYVRWTREVA